jgi:NADH dehydrogenase FAD-containing subunit
MNRIIVETTIGVLWTILKIIELYLWIPTRLYKLYLSFIIPTVASTASNRSSSTTVNNNDSDEGGGGDYGTKTKIKTVVIVGGNFAGLAALWKLLDEQVKIASSGNVHHQRFRIILLDQRDYSEYTPGILRLFCEPTLLDTLAQSLPPNSNNNNYKTSNEGINPCCHDYQFIQGKVMTIVENSRSNDNRKSDDGFWNVLTYTTATGGTGSVIKLEYDYLILATGMTYRQDPITPNSTTETTLQGRLQSWKKSYRQLQQARRIIVLGGGAVGVELAAEIVDAQFDGDGDDSYDSKQKKKKHITLIDVAPELVMNFPKPARTYAQRWLQRRGVDVKLNAKLKSWTEKSCTFEDGTVLNAEIVYVCFGSRPNSELMAATTSTTNPGSNNIDGGDSHTTLIGDSARGKLCTLDTLQVILERNSVSSASSVVRPFQDGCIFACGDLATPPFGDEKQALQAETQGKIAAENVIKLLSNDQTTSAANDATKLHRYPQDIAGYGVMPLVFVLSLGKYDGVLGFNALCIPGPIAAIVKWVLEYTKVLEMRGKVLGRIIWIIAENVVFFVSRTVLLPTTTATTTTTAASQKQKAV